MQQALIQMSFLIDVLLLLLLLLLLSLLLILYFLLTDLQSTNRSSNLDI